MSFATVAAVKSMEGLSSIPEFQKGDRVVSRYSDGLWYWGRIIDKYRNRKNALLYSILYEDGKFVREFYAQGAGILSEAEYEQGALMADETLFSEPKSSSSSSDHKEMNDDKKGSKMKMNITPHNFVDLTIDVKEEMVENLCSDTTTTTATTTSATASKRTGDIAVTKKTLDPLLVRMRKDSVSFTSSNNASSNEENTKQIEYRKTAVNPEVDEYERKRPAVDLHQGAAVVGAKKKLKISSTNTSMGQIEVVPPVFPKKNAPETSAQASEDTESFFISSSDNTAAANRNARVAKETAIAKLNSSFDYDDDDGSTCETTVSPTPPNKTSTKKKSNTKPATLSFYIDPQSSGKQRLQMYFDRKRTRIGKFETKEQAEFVSAIMEDKMKSALHNGGMISSERINSFIQESMKTLKVANDRKGKRGKRITSATTTAADSATAAFSIGPDEPDHFLTLADVVMGRASGIRNFPGNKIFYQLVDSYQQKFAEATTAKSKKKIAHAIVQQIQSRGGFFVKPVDSSNIQEGQPCFIVSDEKSFEKTRQRLIDINRSQTNSGKIGKIPPMESQPNVMSDKPNSTRLRCKAETSSSPIAPARAQSMRHTICFLVAQRAEYLERNPAAKLTRIVFDEDRELLGDYYYFVINQMHFCRLSIDDKKVGTYGRQHMAVGRGGIQCIHCTRKFFPSNADSFANSFGNIPSHVLYCRGCPPKIQEALIHLQKNRTSQVSLLPKGFKRIFAGRLMSRLQDGDPDPKDSEDENPEAVPTVASIPMEDVKGVSRRMTEGAPLASRGYQLKSAPAPYYASSGSLPTAGANMPSDASSSAFGFSGGDDEGHNSAKDDPSLISFLQSQASCLKICPMEFHQFLVSEDIVSLGLLLKALDDSDYVNKVLRNNGLFFFKRITFSNAARRAAAP